MFGWDTILISLEWVGGCSFSAWWSNCSTVVIWTYCDDFLNNILQIQICHAASWWYLIAEKIPGADRKTGREFFHWAFPNAYLRFCWHTPFLKYSQNVSFSGTSLNKKFLKSMPYLPSWGLQKTMCQRWIESSSKPLIKYERKQIYWLRALWWFDSEGPSERYYSTVCTRLTRSACTCMLVPWWNQNVEPTQKPHSWNKQDLSSANKHADISGIQHSFENTSLSPHSLPLRLHETCMRASSLVQTRVPKRTQGCRNTDTLNGSLPPCHDPCVHV